MKTSRGFALTVFLSGLLALGPLPAQAEYPLPSGFDALNVRLTAHEPVYDPGVANPLNFPNIFGKKVGATQNSACGFTIDENCQDPNGSLQLPVCTSSTETWCIEDVRLGEVGTAPAPLTFERETAGLKILNLGPRSLPRSGTASVWKASNGSLYLASAGARFQTQGSEYLVNELVVSLVEVTQVTCAECRIPRLDSNGFISPDLPSTFRGEGWINVPGFLLSENGSYLAEKSAALPYEAKISLRLPSTFRGGFFFGRIQSPEIDVTSSRDTGGDIWQFSGTSVEVPVLDTFIVGRDMTPEFKALYQSRWDRLCARLNRCPIALTGIGWTGPMPSTWSTEILDAARSQLRDISPRSSTRWYLKQQVTTADSCYGKDKVSGILSTNALTFEGYAPQLRDGFLSYRVAGLHYLPDAKTEHLGSYDLVLTGEVARCLYGFSKIPTSATVQVIGDSGEQKVATTSLRDRNGFLSFSAKNFTFSGNEIRVKLEEPKIQSNVPFSTVIAKFQNKSSKLTASQKRQISSAIEASLGQTSVTCTGRYRGATNKALATSRAKAVCAHIASLNGELAAVIRTQLTTSKAADGSVSVISK